MPESGWVGLDGRWHAVAKEPFDQILENFVDGLRASSGGTPSTGLVRVFRNLQGGAGIAARVLRSRGRPALASSDQASLEVLVSRLGELKGIPMKLGQFVGFLELDLPEEVRRLFAVLQTQSQATPFSVIEETLRADLGEAAAPLLAGMLQPPVSIASIGQVHQAVMPGGERVAVKVRHPGIEEALRSDLSGAVAATAIARLLLPGIGASACDFVEEAKERFLEECDYQLEAERQQLFGRIFEGHQNIVVPQVFSAWCGPRVLTTTWEDGRDFDAVVAGAPQAVRDRAGRALFDAYVGTLYRHGVFHADPHPGNYRFREDGRMVLFDYGCVRVFRPQEVAAFIGLVDAVRAGDEEGMRASLRGLGAEPDASAEAFARVRQLLEGFFAPMLTPGAHSVASRIVVDVRQIASDKLAIARMRLPGKLLFLLRIRFGLYSVLARLGAVCDWSTIEAGWAEEARERWRVNAVHETTGTPGE